MKKNAKKMQWPQKYVSFAFICNNMQEYAKICKICKHEIHVHDMQECALDFAGGMLYICI